MREPIDRFILRIPRRLRNNIFDVAKMYRRSVNSEILLRLEYTLNGIPNQELEKALEPAMFPQIERILRGNLTKEEEKLLICFRRLSSDRRKALMDLLS